MDRTLAEFAASDAPLRQRLRVARELAAAAAGLAARGKVHGALVPDAVVVLEGATVALRPAAAAPLLAGAGFDAPEVARGERPSPRSDAFSVGALAWLALAGRPPFEADDRLEEVRRVLHVEPGPVRIHAPGVPPEVEETIAALLEKGARRRGHPAELVRTIDAVLAPASAGRAPPLPGPLAPRPRRHLPTILRLARALAARARSLSPLAARAFRAARALPPLPRTALAVLPVVAISLASLPRTDGALARSVADRLEHGDVASARALVDEAARRRPADPVVEKLRGDVACARGAPGECLRRYRVAIASRPELREDPSVRANARRLLDRTESCGTRRAAAQLLGELRDRGALPALEEARRSAGVFAVFCTGDSIDRAITATRADARM